MGIRPAGVVKVLYINPTIEQKSSEPVEDFYTQVMEELLSGLNRDYQPMKYAVAGVEAGAGEYDEGGAYRGWHTSCDGTHSTNQDYFFEKGCNPVWMTNSLAPHYLRWFRSAVPDSDLIHVMRMAKAFGLADDDATIELSNGSKILRYKGSDYCLMPDGSLRGWNWDTRLLSGYMDDEFKERVLAHHNLS